MKCPFCQHAESKVLDSRESEGGFSIRRRRECLSCEKRYTTYERIEELSIMVVKKDGSREPFERKKLLNGLVKACNKRPISLMTIENIVDEIEEKTFIIPGKEITSEELGELVMKRLHELDEVSYVRFASVYRQFKDVGQFMEELKGLLNNKDHAEKPTKNPFQE
ncbi:transcriptional repressor NrdR [bacterium]|nr:transcriptional repressor NrdR [bacterium]